MSVLLPAFFAPTPLALLCTLTLGGNRITSIAGGQRQSSEYVSIFCHKTKELVSGRVGSVTQV